MPPFVELHKALEAVTITEFNVKCRYKIHLPRQALHINLACFETAAGSDDGGSGGGSVFSEHLGRSVAIKGHEGKGKDRSKGKGQGKRLVRTFLLCLYSMDRIDCAGSAKRGQSVNYQRSTFHRIQVLF